MLRPSPSLACKTGVLADARHYPICRLCRRSSYLASTKDLSTQDAGRQHQVESHPNSSSGVPQPSSWLATGKKKKVSQPCRAVLGMA